MSNLNMAKLSIRQRQKKTKGKQRDRQKKTIIHTIYMQIDSLKTRHTSTRRTRKEGLGNLH